MFYSFDVTVPALTTEASAVEQTAEMVPGLIHRVELQFPKGCVGLVKARVWHAAHQLWPSNPGGSIASDGFLVAWDERWELAEEPMRLRLQVWNDDDTFAHTLTFRFALAEAPLPAPVGPELAVWPPDAELVELV